jgi:sugar phosphate isomerase/epimerase
MKIGIRAHDLGKGTIYDIARLAKDHDIKYLQLVLSKAIIEDDGLLNELKAQTIQDVLHMNNLQVAMMGAYFNPVHSKEEVVKSGIEKFKNHLKYVSLLNCNYVGTETGSYNDDSWTYHPCNRTEEAYQTVLRIVLDLCQYSQDYHSKVVCEGAYGHVIYTPERLKRLVDDVETIYPGRIKVIIDLYNYLNYDNHHNHYQILTQAIELLKDKIVIFHLKDYILDEGKLRQVCIGKGLMDYPRILNLIQTNCPDACLIFEGISGKDINESLTFISHYIKENENGSK